MQGALGKGSNEFSIGIALGFALTFVIGLVTYLYKSPAKGAALFTIGIATVSIGGSAIYRVLQGPTVFYLTRKGRYPTGSLGYLIGCLAGLLFLGLVLTFKASGSRVRRAR